MVHIWMAIKNLVMHGRRFGNDCNLFWFFEVLKLLQTETMVALHLYSSELLDLRDRFPVVEFAHVNYTTCHPKNTFPLSIHISKHKKDVFL